MITFILGMGALLGLVYLVRTLMTTKEPVQNTNTPVKSETEVQAKIDEVLRVAETPVEEPKKGTCGCGRSPTGDCVGLHKLTDAEWAMSDQNPNRVEVAPVVVTAETTVAATIDTTTSETTAEAAPAKKPRAKKAATPKAKKAQ